MQWKVCFIQLALTTANLNIEPTDTEFKMVYRKLQTLVLIKCDFKDF